jgi:two-component system cell cycle sensor histidine kinase/response regulator CckA
MSKRILLVDGDQSIVESVNGMLEGMGHQVRTETSGADALDVFASDPGGFDLVITDLGMPDISGFLLVKKLLQLRSDIPIVLLTSPDGQAQSMERQSGIRWFGIKPLSITDLAGTVENALVETG